MPSEALDHDNWYTGESEAMKSKPGLCRRNGTYYVRMRVPTPVSKTLGKTHIKISLRTTDYAEACVRYSKAVLKIHAVIASVPLDEPQAPRAQCAVSDDQLRAIAIAQIAPKWAATQRDLWKPPTFVDVVEDPVELLQRELDLLHSSDDAVYRGFLHAAKNALIAARISDADAGSVEMLASFLRRGEIAITDASLRHYNRDTSHVLRDEMFTAFNIASVIASPSLSTRQAAPPHDRIQRVTVEQAIQRFNSDPQRAQLGAKNAQGYATGFKLLREIAGSNTPLSDVTVEQARELQTLLSQLPPNATKRYPGLTAKEAANAAAANGHPPLQAKTAANVLARLSAFFRWAVNEEIVARPRFNDFGPLQKKKPRAQSRRSFNPSELAKLFSNEMFVQEYEACGASRPSRYWIPLLALYHGCRLNEICQMEPTDITFHGETLCMHLTEEGVAGHTKRLKTRNAERTIPIHPVLLRLGFREHWERVTAAREKLLFPDLTQSAEGSLSDNFSKWFGNYCQRQGLSDSRLVFHSFRHGFVDACRAENIDQSVYRRIGGWSGATSEAERYGTGYAIERIADELRKIHFPHVEKLLPALQGVNDVAPEHNVQGSHNEAISVRC